MGGAERGARRRCRAAVPEDVPAGTVGEWLFLCPIVTGEKLKGVIVVEASDELPIDLTNTLETLAAQVGLALDREDLTDAFHARRSELRFQTLVQSASDVILIARPDTTIPTRRPQPSASSGTNRGRSRAGGSLR